MRTLQISALFILCFGLIPLACEGPCGPGNASDFLIQEVNIEAFDMGWNPVASGDTISPQSGLRFLLSVDEFQEVISESFPIFINTAHACSPRPSLALNHLASLDIIANQAVVVRSDTLFYPNSSLNEIFRAKYYGESITFEEILGYDFPYQQPLEINLYSTFTDTSTLDLTVRVELDDDQVYVFEDLRFHFN